jgi:hypothetical protein
MRIGTWNLAGRWSPHHHDLMQQQDCDVWLLTEVSTKVFLAGHKAHLVVQEMAPKRRWAGVFSRIGLTALPDPHPASATAIVESTTFCSSILPWRGCGHRAPWVGHRHADKTEHTISQLESELPRRALVWGGDWNHALSGHEYAGSIGGRAHILRALQHRELQTPTADLPHRIDGLLSIDHIAVSDKITVKSSSSVPAEHDGIRLSDHDAYVIGF